MIKFFRAILPATALLITVASLAACGMSNNPKKTQKALEKHNYVVETILGDNDLDAQAELDGMSDEMNITAGELVAMLSATKEDESGEFLTVYYFKDGYVANKYWDSNREQLNAIKERYKNVDGFEMKKVGSVVYYGTRQAIADAM